MASQFQNRLIGTIILVSLGIIFLPDLLSGKPSGSGEPVASLPLRPEAHPTKPALAAPESPPAPVSSALEASAAVAVAGNTASSDKPWAVEDVAAPVTLDTQGVEANQVVPASTRQPVADAAPAAPAAPVASEPRQVVATPAAPEPKVEPTKVEPAVTEAAPEKKFVPQIKPFAESVQAKSPAAVETVASSHGSNWVIQVGVFQNGDNARALVSKLRAAGYPANVQLIGSSSNRLNRVIVGPNVSREKLEQLLPGVNRVGGTAGKVVSYNPLG